jgi:hypothetical protein
MLPSLLLETVKTIDYQKLSYQFPTQHRHCATAQIDPIPAQAYTNHAAPLRDLVGDQTRF